MTDATTKPPADIADIADIAVETAPRGRRHGRVVTALRWLVKHPPVVTLLLIVAVAVIVGTINPSFWQISNVFDIARASVVRGLFALGVLIVLAAGGLDISFTAIAAFVMYAITKTVVAVAPGTPIVAIFLVAMVGGALLGSMNGILVNRLRAPSLIVTIGTQYVIRGILLTFIGTGLFMNIPLSMEAFGKYELMRQINANGFVAILPAYVLVLVAAALVTWWILERTLIGRAIFAVGGNAAIAERLGYNLLKVHVFVFAYAGLLAGVAGIIHVASNRLANPFDLAGSEMDVIAAVVLGGARITGGSGSVIGTMLGVILITLVHNVLILAGIPSTWQLVIVGGFIALAGMVFSLRV